jgi:hypothetical protein
MNRFVIASEVKQYHEFAETLSLQNDPVVGPFTKGFPDGALS